MDGAINFDHFDQHMEKAVKDLMSLGSDPAMAGFVSTIAVFPMLNLALLTTLVEELSGAAVTRKVADEMETFLAKFQIESKIEVSDRMGPTVADGCELALEVYRALFARPEDPVLAIRSWQLERR